MIIRDALGRGDDARGLPDADAALAERARGHVRAERGHGRLLAAPRRRRAARPARRAGAIRGHRIDLRHPAAPPVGQPAGGLRLRDRPPTRRAGQNPPPPALPPQRPAAPWPAPPPPPPPR